MHILLVEPNPILAEVYRGALEEIGQVHWSKGAQNAVSLADEQKPDVVILEPQLSRHNGIEFLYEFRSYQEWQDVPIVLLTSSDVPALLGENIETLGVAIVLDKSQTTSEELARAVKSVVKAPKS